MSCIIPQRIVNPHYKKLSNETGVRLYTFEQNDDFYLDVPCGKCYHCLKKYKSQWNFRLQEHYKNLSLEEKFNSYFITLTFDETHLPKNVTKSTLSPIVRKFFERIRKHCKVSCTHWLVTEYGEQTHRLHFHGILFNVPFPIYKLPCFWKNGYVSYAPLTERRISYITSYVTKLEKDIIQLPENKQYVFTSPKIGLSYCDNPRNVNLSHFKGRPNPFTYFGTKPFALPRYLRNKLFTEEEKKELKDSYFYFRSEDVIPDGPYLIANRVYDDYTAYLADTEKYRQQYNNLYKSNYKCQTIQHTTPSPL